ncbi:hypothetical protein HOY80DRAFT_893849 [Tuber brumale]|nr:hypothetical protein HOY80DRAFT_893849 [Tuber brumale]
MYLSTVMTAQIPDVKPTLFGLSSPRSPTNGYTCAFPSWPSRPCLDRRMPWEDDDEEEEPHECAGRRKDGRCNCPTTVATAAPSSSSAERWDGRSVSSTCASSTSSTSTHATGGKVETLITGFEKLPLQPRSPKAPSGPTKSLLSLAILGKAGGDM